MVVRDGARNASIAAAKKTVQHLVKPFEATVIPIRILDSIADIGIKSTDDGVISGVVKDGVIHLFRDGMADGAKVATTLWHEMLHFGLRRFMTHDQYIRAMRALYQQDAWIPLRRADRHRKVERKYNAGVTARGNKWHNDWATSRVLTQ